MALIMMAFGSWYEVVCQTLACIIVDNWLTIVFLFVIALYVFGEAPFGICMVVSLSMVILNGPLRLESRLPHNRLHKVFAQKSTMTPLDCCDVLHQWFCFIDYCCVPEMLVVVSSVVSPTQSV